MTTEIIAEVGQAHEGSVGMAHSFIDALAGSGIHAVKFQTHIAEAESSEHESFRINFSYEDKTRFDYWKRMEFTVGEWRELKNHCESVNLEFISSPFSLKAVDLLEEIGVKRYKLGSGEISNLLMIEKLSRIGKPTILSSGLSDWEELKQAIHFLQAHRVDVSVLQCTTAYPTQPAEWGLNLISELKEQFHIKTGFSDHSGTVVSGLAAVALGAEILEFHATFDRRMFGPDSKASLTIDEIRMLCDGVLKINESLNNPVRKDNISSFEQLKMIFGKSLAVNRDMKKGERILFEDLESKKPYGKGIPAEEFNSILGKYLNKDVKKWAFISHADLYE